MKEEHRRYVPVLSDIWEVPRQSGASVGVGMARAGMEMKLYKPGRLLWQNVPISRINRRLSDDVTVASHPCPALRHYLPHLPTKYHSNQNNHGC